MARKAGRGNPRAGLRPTPYRQRRSFRFWDDETVMTVWDWVSQRDEDGFAIFTQREIAEYLNMSVTHVGNIARCMPEGYEPRRKR